MKTNTVGSDKTISMTSVKKNTIILKQVQYLVNEAFFMLEAL